MMQVVPYISFLSWGVQWVWPLLQSCRILRGDAERKKKQQDHWVTYWVICALFSVLEVALRLDLIPLFFELKFAFFFWLTANQFNGASWIWNNHAEKFFPLIDDPFQEFTSKHGWGGAAKPTAAARNATFDAAQEEQNKYLAAAKAAGVAPSGAVGSGTSNEDKKD